MSEAAARLIDRLPKAELHLHIEGTLEPEMMLALSERNRIKLPYLHVEDVRKAYQFNCLQDFLDLYYLGMSVLRTSEDFYDLTWAYLNRVHGDRAVHVEIFFDPQGHTGRGVAFEAVLDGITSALARAERELGITSRLIMCFLRHLSEDDAFEALSLADPYREQIFGIGLDSSELGHPPHKFARVFAAARDEGYVPVAHAGEEGPADYVREALDELKVVRIDHGNSALADAALTSRLASEQVPLTMCPLSNLRLRVIPDMAASPVRRALEAGLLVTVNSDDPSYFGGYLNDNYHAVQQHLELDAAQITALARNSFNGSFLLADDKRKWLAEIERVAAGLPN